MTPHPKGGFSELLRVRVRVETKHDPRQKRGHKMPQKGLVLTLEKSKYMNLPKSYNPLNDCRLQISQTGKIFRTEPIPNAPHISESDRFDGIYRYSPKVRRNIVRSCAGLAVENLLKDHVITFHTLTFTPEFLDSFDLNQTHKYLLRYTDNLTKRYNAQYVWVTEHHKTGRIHYHILVSSLGRKSDYLPHITDWSLRYSGSVNGLDIRSVAWKYGGRNIYTYMGKYMSKGNVESTRRLWGATRGLKSMNLDLPEHMFQTMLHDGEVMISEKGSTHLNWSPESHVKLFQPF